MLVQRTNKLERAVDGATSQIPTLKLLTPAPQVPPLGHDPGDRMKIPFDMIHIFYRGIRFRLTCTHIGQFLIGAKLFKESPWMRNEVVLKCMGHVKMHGFHGNPLYESREWG